MVRMIYCVMRRDEIPLNEFRDFFEGEHRELFHEAAEKLNAIDFKQSLTLMIERNFTVMVRRGTEMPYDGVIELWWKNAAELEKKMETEESQNWAEMLFKKSERYIDLSKSRMFFTEQPKTCL